MVYVSDFFKFRFGMLGNLVGMDRFGNKYYRLDDEDAYHCQTRYVEYADKWMEGRPDCIPPEWHRWLHQTTDIVPSEGTSTATATPDSTSLANSSPFYQGHQSNQTGSNGRYVPYSTTVPKIISWTGPSKSVK